MEIYEYKIENANQTDPINIYFLGDIHEGNAAHAGNAFVKAVHMIRDDPNGYWVGMGDMIDAINHKDPRFDPIEISKRYTMADLKDLPKAQIRRLYQDLYKIEDKCICLLRGNHEETYIKHNSYDPMETLQDLMKPHPKIMGYTGFLRIILQRSKTARISYDISLSHGTGGGGTTEGYPINIVHRWAKYKIADVHVMGHIHRMGVDRETFSTVGSSGNNMYLQKKAVWYGSSGCFLYKDLVGCRPYFSAKAGPESDIGVLRLVINLGKTKKDSSIRLEPIWME